MPLKPAEKRWEVLPTIPEPADQSLSEYPPVIRQLLYNRGIESAEAAAAFLNARLPDHDPFLLLGMQQAVNRIKDAIESDEQIAVYGDYDVDGLTSTALLVDALTRLGGRALPYIPNRFDEGYGLNNEALQSLHDQGVGLAISVDCGIRSITEAEHARRIGLDLIITDHHHPGEIVPPAEAVINPRLEGDPYPDKELTGVGIAYKLACGLAAALDRHGLQTSELLDLVALGTVADVAPLTGENRAMVNAGLRLLSRPRRPGLSALLGVSRLYGKPIQAQHIGFIIGPRLNAAGRLDSAEKAYRLLATTDPREAGLLAQELDDQNRQRQEITRATQTMAEERLGEEEVILIADAHESYNPG
ncbi:MAG: DHH family phosphoesterase, partial [Anaerolineales bacterium]|nr:DHH family phosphoesterase [Anaerolineales bacterium]